MSSIIVRSDANPRYWREYRTICEALRAHAAKHRGREIRIEEMAYVALDASETVRGYFPPPLWPPKLTRWQHLRCILGWQP